MALRVIHHRHEQRRAVGHGRIHHLALAGVARLGERGEHADHQQHRAATAVGHQIERHHRLAAGLADGVSAPERQVVDVVPGAWASGPVWPQPVMRP